MSNNTISNAPDQHTLSVYVSNKPGVLARIAQTFARRGFNIDSLVVSSAVDGNYSRMTITAQGDPERLDQIIMQVSKLVDVLHCTDHTGQNAVVKEMALIKIEVGAGQRTEILQVAEHFGCKTVDFTETSVILQAVGDSGKIDALVDLAHKYRIVELIRAGAIGSCRSMRSP